MALLMSGCLWQSVSDTDIRLGNAWCADKGGLKSVAEYWHGKTEFICGNEHPGASSTNEIRASKILLEKAMKWDNKTDKSPVKSDK